MAGIKIEKLRETEFSSLATEWFESKGIGFEVLNYVGIYTQKFDDEVWVAFPCYDEKGEIANTRMGTLKDGQIIGIDRMDGKDMFYNMQALELAVKEDKPLVVCQREMDVLSFLQSGYAWTIGYIEGDNILWEYLDQFEGIEKIVVAGYNNDKGRAFNELVSTKLGIERCLRIELPEDCVTANDALRKHDNLAELVAKAKHFPIVGLYKPDEFPPLPEEYKATYRTGFGREHDYHIKLMLGKLMTVTGIPGHGKSEWADALCLNLAKRYGWKLCICSTEINHEEYQENTLRRYLRRPFEKVGKNEPANALEFYQEHYTFITNTTLDDELELTLEKLIELAKIAILRDGCKVVMLDPWNEIEHTRKASETETEYTSRAIRMLKRLAKVYKVLVIIVAHPKMPEQGRLKCPTLYSISGSAHWFNKSDYGIILWRENPSGDQSEVRVAKIKRHGAMGKPGSITVRLDNHTRNFEEIA